jgi:2-methylcitrate dehydratase PrpD
MTRRAVSIGALAAAVAAAAFWSATALLDGPWGMIPGGRLRGPEAPCEQARWTQLSALREIELEVGRAGRGR